MLITLNAISSDRTNWITITHQVTSSNTCRIWMMVSVSTRPSLLVALHPDAYRPAQQLSMGSRYGAACAQRKGAAGATADGSVARPMRRDQANARAARRRWRIAPAIAPKPKIIIAQVDGSGTAAARLSISNELFPDMKVAPTICGP